MSPIDATEAEMLDHVLVALIETRRGIAAFHALETSLMASMMAYGIERSDGSRGDGDMAIREISAEIATALRMSDRTVARRLEEALRTTQGFPRALVALREGRIDRGHLDVIVAAGSRLDDDDARASYETSVLAVAERESVNRLKPVARVLAERAMPTSLAERHEAARAQRRVDVRDLDDGMAQLIATLPGALAHGIRARVSAMASTLKGADEADPRTFDQLRADLALTGTPEGHDADTVLSAIRAEVHVTVPALALAGTNGFADAGDAVLEGSAPVDLETARTLCAGAPGWERVLTHPVSGMVLAVDRYRPSAELRRSLRARDQRCRFPGCRVTASHCDIDHVHDHAHGGATAHDNLAHVCRRHHMLKHHSAWTVQLNPDRTMTWRSPLGRAYSETPAPPGVAFRPDGEPPPF